MHGREKSRGDRRDRVQQHRPSSVIRDADCAKPLVARDPERLASTIVEAVSLQ